MRWMNAAILLLLCGCASTHQFVPKPNSLQTAPDKVVIQIKRPLQWCGFGNPYIISDMDQVIGHLGPRGELLWERDAGEMNLTIRLKYFHLYDFKPVILNTTAGEKYEFKAAFSYWPPFSRRLLKPVKGSPHLAEPTNPADGGVAVVHGK